MALIEPYSIIYVYGVAQNERHEFLTGLCMKPERFAGHHEAMEALVLSVAGVMAVLVIASLMLLLIR